MNLTAYLKTTGLLEEFTYIGKARRNNIENHNHTTNLLYFPFLSMEERLKIVKDYVFADIDMFDSAIYDKDLTIAFIGMMIEPNLGIYRNKKTGRKIAFGEYSHPLTDPKEWDSYINGTIFNADNAYTREWLQWFSDTHDFLGSLTPKEILDDYRALLAKMSPSAKLCILLGSELPFDKEKNKNYFGRNKIYKEINELIRKWAQVENRVLVLDFNNYIHGQDDFTNNINHFQRRVYYQAATEARQIILELVGIKLKQKNKIYLKVKELADDIGKTGFYQSTFWGIIRKPYVMFRDFLGTI